MHREDFLKLIGGEQVGHDFFPVACLLQNGYGCAGHFVRALNEDVAQTCVLVNARLIELAAGTTAQRGAVHGFGDFIEEIVTQLYAAEGSFADSFLGSVEHPSKSVPLMAIGFEEISVVYPVGQINRLMHRLAEERPDTKGAAPSFLDFDNRSVVIKLLRTKLW